MPKIPAPSPTYLGPARFHGGPQGIQPLKRIVIHGTVSPCKPGGARAIASYFRNTVTRPSSCHYVVDPAEVVQVVGDHQIAYHAPPNSNTIGIEHCDPVSGPATRWADANHVAMLNKSAKLVAQLCLAYDVPIRHVGGVGLKVGLRGITGHVDVGKAWKQTSHYDPGADFPWSRYIGLVKTYAKALTAGPTLPPVAPIPPLPMPGPLVTTMAIVTSNIKNNPDLDRAHVRADTKLVRGLGGVLLWQEIAEADDREDLATSCPPDHWHTVELETECPISLARKNWTVHDHGRLKLHGGHTGVSPHRYVTWAEVSRNGSLVPPVIVMNTHWVSGAWGNAGQLAEAWRTTAWDTAHSKQTELVGKFLAAGKTVIGGGDFNRTGGWPGFAPQHRWLMHGGFDHLWCAEALGGTRVRLDLTGTLGTDKLYTDHPARWARVTLQSPPRPISPKRK